MDSQVNQPQPAQEQPALPPPASPHSTILPLLLVGGIMLLMGLGGGYLLGKTNNQENKQKIVAVTSLSPSPTLAVTPTAQIEMPYETIQESFSPDKSYLVTYSMLADHQKMSIKDKDGTEIVKNILELNNEAIDKNMRSQGLTGGGQSGYKVKEWKNNSTFILQVLPANGMEFEVDVEAKAGIIDESSFKRIK